MKSDEIKTSLACEFENPQGDLPSKNGLLIFFLNLYDRRQIYSILQQAIETKIALKNFQIRTAKNNPLWDNLMGSFVAHLLLNESSWNNFNFVSPKMRQKAFEIFFRLMNFKLILPSNKL